jgi:hypothetical protein
MSKDTTVSKPSPDRTDVIPETFAIYVTDQYVQVWQYRIGLSRPNGEWVFVETLNRDDEPRLSLEYAQPMPPASEGYWIYSKSYDCELDCE